MVLFLRAQKQSDKRFPDRRAGLFLKAGPGILGGLPEWLKGPDCKFGSSAFTGLNPVFATRRVGEVGRPRRVHSPEIVGSNPASATPVWRNWQTRQPQELVSFGTSEFKSGNGHCGHEQGCPSAGINRNALTGGCMPG